VPLARHPRVLWRYARDAAQRRMRQLHESAQIAPADPSIAVDKTSLEADALAAASKLHAWSPGDAVRVPRFGAGEVALTSGEQVAMVFPDSKTRTFMSSNVKARQSRRH
jgi:hypothetical protein